MSYQEKRTFVSVLTGCLILLAYCICAYTRYQSGDLAIDDTRSWAGVMLLFIGIGVVIGIAIEIVFHILLSISIAIQQRIQTGECDEKQIEQIIEHEVVTDEMDRLIELKSMRVGFVIAGIGFVLALVSLVLNYSPVVMINIIFISFLIGSLIEGCAQLYFYKTGVYHG